MTQTSPAPRPVRIPFGALAVTAALVAAVIGWDTVSAALVDMWAIVVTCALYPVHLATQEPHMLMAVVTVAIIAAAIASKIVRKGPGR